MYNRHESVQMRTAYDATTWSFHMLMSLVRLFSSVVLQCKHHFSCTHSLIFHSTSFQQYQQYSKWEKFPLKTVIEIVFEQKSRVERENGWERGREKEIERFAHHHGNDVIWMENFSRKSFTNFIFLILNFFFFISFLHDLRSCWFRIEFVECSCTILFDFHSTAADYWNFVTHRRIYANFSAWPFSFKWFAWGKLCVEWIEQCKTEFE